jgi:hypothetical protein
MFAFESVEFSTIGRLTLFFTDTVHKTNPNNVSAANFIITGGASVGGNFQIFANSISFDILLAETGKVYDIQVQNLISAQNEALDLTMVRESFYFGIGVIDPYFVNKVEGIGSLYIISDPALIGKI